MTAYALHLLKAFVLISFLFEPLANPVLVYKGSVNNGSEFIQYNFSVENYRDFPDELFQAAPDLPPCGLNHSASRTWVEIFDDIDKRIYGFAR